MSTSRRVDVIIASPEFQADLDEQVAAAVEEIRQTDAIEHVDVAPDPKQRIVVLAPSKVIGRDEALAAGIDPVAIVTPRSVHAAHGVVADALWDAPGLTPEDREALMPHVAPCLATTREA